MLYEIVNDSPYRLRPLALVHCTVRHSWRQLRQGGTKDDGPGRDGLLSRSGVVNASNDKALSSCRRSIRPVQRDQTRILAQTPAETTVTQGIS